MPNLATPPPGPPPIAITGPDLCVAFANTRYWRGSPVPTEEIGAPADLLVWCGGTGGISRTAIGEAGAAWEGRPGEATAELAKALEMREAIYAILVALAEKRAVAGADIDILNAALAQTPVRSRLRTMDGGFAWSVAGLEPRAHSLLAPVLWSAGDMLASPRRERVRCCSNEKCRYAFVDDSRAGTRRWCSMSACGNRAKAHRHYERHRKG